MKSARFDSDLTRSRIGGAGDTSIYSYHDPSLLHDVINGSKEQGVDGGSKVGVGRMKKKL